MAVNTGNTDELQKPRFQSQNTILLSTISILKRENSFAVYLCKTTKEPMYTLLTGDVSVGKPQVVEALYNALLGYYFTVPGNDQDDTHILDMAYTGRTSYGI